MGPLSDLNRFVVVDLRAGVDLVVFHNRLRLGRRVDTISGQSPVGGLVSFYQGKLVILPRRDKFSNRMDTDVSRGAPDREVQALESPQIRHAIGMAPSKAWLELPAHEDSWNRPRRRLRAVFGANLLGDEIDEATERQPQSGEL